MEATAALVCLYDILHILVFWLFVVSTDGMSASLCVSLLIQWIVKRQESGTHSDLQARAFWCKIIEDLVKPVSSGQK